MRTISKKHPSHDVIFPAKSWQTKTKLITSHDVLEPLKQALASRAMIISGQICGSKLQRVFTLGDRCWLPIQISRSDFGSTDSYSWAAGFFSRILTPDCSSHFCGKKCAEKKSPGKSPANPPKFIQQKSPTRFCRRAGPTNPS